MLWRKRQDDVRDDIGRLSETLAKLTETINSGFDQIHNSLQNPIKPTKMDAINSDGDDLASLLELAAGITYAELSCHRDTWDFLVTQSAGGEHFRLPGGIKETDGIVEVRISGRTLTAVLEALWKSKTDQTENRSSAGTRFLASRVSERIGDALRSVQPGVRQAPQGRADPARIVIDDRPAPAADTTSDS